MNEWKHHVNSQGSSSWQQESCRIRLITVESITKQKPVSGRKIVGSAAEGLISILYCTGAPRPDPFPSPGSKRMAAEGEEGQGWKRGCRGPDGGCWKSRKTASQRQARLWRGDQGLRPWNQAPWGDWVQVQLQILICMLSWWRQNVSGGILSDLALNKTPTENLCTVRQERKGNVVRCNLSFLT